MTDQPRPPRDILAECMRRERLGDIRPSWADKVKFADDECEHVRRRADHLIRLLADYGLAVIHVGEPKADPFTPASRDIYRYHLAARPAERVVRKGAGDRWEVITIESGTETVEQTFTIAEATVNCGLVLTDDPSARSVPGLGRQLAALNEIYRLNAVSMAGPEE